MSNYFIKINAYQANTSKVYNIFIKFSNNYERIRNSNHIPYYSLQLNLLEKQTYVIRITSQMLFLFILELTTLMELWTIHPWLHFGKTLFFEGTRKWGTRVKLKSILCPLLSGSCHVRLNVFHMCECFFWRFSEEKNALFYAAATSTTDTTQNVA